MINAWIGYIRLLTVVLTLSCVACTPDRTIFVRHPIPTNWSTQIVFPEISGDYKNIPKICRNYAIDYIYLAEVIATTNIKNAQLQKLETLNDP